MPLLPQPAWGGGALGVEVSGWKWDAPSSESGLQHSWGSRCCRLNSLLVSMHNTGLRTSQRLWSPGALRLSPELHAPELGALGQRSREDLEPQRSPFTCPNSVLLTACSSGLVIDPRRPRGLFTGPNSCLSPPQSHVLSGRAGLGSGRG